MRQIWPWIRSSGPISAPSPLGGQVYRRLWIHPPPHRSAGRPPARRRPHRSAHVDPGRPRQPRAMHDVRTKKRDRESSSFAARRRRSAIARCFRSPRLSQLAWSRAGGAGWFANLSAPLPSTSLPAALLMDASRRGSAFSEDTASMSLSAYPSPIDIDKAAPVSASARTLWC